MSANLQLDLCRAYLQSTANVKIKGAANTAVEGPVVTISRAAGARGNSIAEVLVRELEKNDRIPKRHPWTLFNQNLVQQVIEEHRLPETTAEYFPEDKADDVRAVIAEILGLHHGVYTTVRKTAETIRRIAKAGNTVIVGRGANLITADISNSVHVRLVGNLEIRIRHFAQHFGLSRKQAAAEVVRLDRARKRYIRAHFKADIDDPLLYDLTLNTDRFSDMEAARLIITALEGKSG